MYKWYKDKLAKYSDGRHYIGFGLPRFNIMKICECIQPSEKAVFSECVELKNTHTEIFQ